MLHELLFALLGYSGSVFEAYPPKPQASSTFLIATEFPFLHPSEREGLNRLGKLGWTFSQINQFITDFKDLKSNKKEHHNEPHGSYIQALIASLETTLNEYRHDITQMETRILNKEDEAGSGVVPLSLLVANLGRWLLLLPALWNFIQLLQQDVAKYHGCRLFNLIIAQSKTGVYEFKAEMEKILMALNNVLYRQLTAWMVYGQLVDPDQEFFIKPCTGSSSSTKKLDIKRSGWNRLYMIDYDLIPAHLPRPLAESILFVGKAIATVNDMLKLPASLLQINDERPFLNSSTSENTARSLSIQKKVLVPNEMKKKHLELLLSLHSSRLQHIPYIPELQKVVGQVRKSTAEWLFSEVLEGDNGLHRYLESFRHLFLLNYGDLADNFIKECASWCKGSSIRSGTFSRNKRPNHTSINSGNTASQTPNSNNSNKDAIIFRNQELNALLSKASIGTDAEDQLGGFSLLLDEEQTLQYPFSDLLLTDIRVVLTYSLEWPIDLFLSESDLKSYSNLWSFLISLKSTQMRLNNLWKLLRTASHKEGSGPNSVTKSLESDGQQEVLVWRVIQLMLFWINTMWNHIQTNVIDSHYQQLIISTTPSNNDSNSTTAPSSSRRRSRVPKTKLDFEDIQTAHDHFLSITMRGCLLRSNECIKTIHNILKICLGFCELMEKITEEGEWRPTKRRKTSAKTATEIVNEWTKPSAVFSWTEDVKSIQEDFAVSTGHFFELASSQLPETKSSGRLENLLTQLDYSNWFSDQKSYAVF